MKKIVSSLLALGIVSFSFAQQTGNHDGHNHGTPASTTTPAAKPVEDVLKMKEMEFDFGKIPQGKPVYHVFEVSNTGKTPLK
ncbi:MAG TPA: DUF1573 domain-containing protein, partial [Chitinophagaceae bacterium]|nr:DUF1573 domain-containing protein [Chitinophagaceae bacterium]